MLLNELFKPSINILFNSLMPVFGNKIIGIIMTGMGTDGRDSFIKLSQIGGYIIAQDPASCVIQGMPKSVIDAGIADEIHPLFELSKVISSFFDI